MKYTAKRQKPQKTFILLDGNSRPLLRFKYSNHSLWLLILCLVGLLSWYQFAEDYHCWVTREINTYKTTKTVNLLQKNVLANIKTNIYSMKKDFLALQKDSNYFQSIVGFTPSDRSSLEIKNAELDKEEIRIEKSLLGQRIERNAVVLNNQIVLEFYEDIKKEDELGATAEQRAILAAKQLKNFLTNQTLKNRVVVKEIEKNTYLGMLGKAMVFNINKNDSKFLSMPPAEAARQWAENINNEIDQIALNRKKINMKNFIAMPGFSSYKRLQKELLALRQKVNKEKQMYIALKKEVRQLTLNFAQTPSAYPLNRPISSTYGLRRHPVTRRLRFHSGTDFWAWPGTRVYATASGRVRHAGWYRGYGYTVKIYHGRGIETLYGHNSKVLVKNGTWVRKGQVIALSGATGLANGAHLHYEVRKWGRPVNPVAFFNLDIRTASRMWSQ